MPRYRLGDTVSIFVSAKDIENGGRGSEDCPLALALRRAVKGWASVGCAGVALLNMGAVHLLAIDQLKAALFVNDFDNHRPVKRIKLVYKVVSQKRWNAELEKVGS